MGIQSHSRSASVLNEAGRMKGVLWGSCLVHGIPCSCAGPGQLALLTGTMREHCHSVPEGSFSWGFFVLLSLASATVLQCPLCHLGLRNPSCLPFSIQPQWKVCSSYPVIQPITPLTSNKPDFSCLVLFLLPYLFPSVTFIPSDLNNLSLPATVRWSFSFFHKFGTNFSQLVLFPHHQSSVCPFLFDPLPHLMSPVVTGAKHRVVDPAAPSFSQTVGGLQRLRIPLDTLSTD